MGPNEFDLPAWVTHQALGGSYIPSEPLRFPGNMHLSYSSLKEVANLLGDSFETMAPQLYAIYKEMELIEKFAKTSELLGGG